MWPFKCTHPARLLAVKRDETTEPMNHGFRKVTYHLYCMNCNKEIDISYAHMIGGLDVWMKRMDKQFEIEKKLSALGIKKD